MGPILGMVDIMLHGIRQVPTGGAFMTDIMPDIIITIMDMAVISIQNIQIAEEASTGIQPEVAQLEQVM